SCLKYALRSKICIPCGNLGWKTICILLNREGHALSFEIEQNFDLKSMALGIVAAEYVLRARFQLGLTLGSNS
ncbi:MAG: hypothetical protein ACTJLL_00680, partial [Anaplasma sp.]